MDKSFHLLHEKNVGWTIKKKINRYITLLLGTFVCGADASGNNKVYRSCNHKSLNIILCGLRLWKIEYGGEILWIEPSLGAETEIPVGLIPSKEDTEVLTTMVSRFEDQIQEADEKEHNIVVNGEVC